jgi:hypothetical protein
MFCAQIYYSHKSVPASTILYYCIIIFIVTLYYAICIIDMTEYKSMQWHRFSQIVIRSLDQTRSRHAELLSLFQSQDALDKKLT